jgi:PadR family transcriptional regulator PadR
MKPVRTSTQTLLLLESLLQGPAEWRYGYDLSRETGLKSGTLYPLLMRLAEKSLLATRWEEAAVPGRPPRHMYRLTALGQQWARAAVPSAHKGRALKPAYGER